MHRLTTASFIAAAALASSPAMATPVEEVDTSQCSAEDTLTLSNCVDGVGSGVTSLDGLRVSTSPASRRTGGDVGEERIAALRGGDTVGMAAGGGMLEGYSLWSSYSYSKFESTTRLGAYDGRTENLLAGIDRFFGEKVLVGVSLAYETTDNTTTFNAGEQDRDGFMVAPYMLFLVNDVLSIDASAGYGRANTDQDRRNTSNAAVITSDFDSDRAFGTVNLNAVVVRGNWVFGGRVGMLHAVESQDAYTEFDATAGAGNQARTVGNRHIDLTQGYVNGDVAYGFGAWEPYVSVGYYRDFSRDTGSSAGGLPGGVVTQNNDRTEWQYGIGLRYFGDGISGSLEWINTNGRKEFDNDTLSVSVRIDF